MTIIITTTHRIINIYALNIYQYSENFASYKLTSMGTLRNFSKIPHSRNFVLHGLRASRK